MKPVGKGGRPAYRRIQAEICGRIATGQLKPGDRVESERELAAIHNVSLMTARQSLSELAKSGLVSRSQGRGTFVASGLAESTPLPGDYGMVYLGACLIAAVRVAHQQPTNFHVRPANLPIEESLELAHKIYNCVSEKHSSSEQPRRNSIGKQRGPAKLR